MTHYETINIYGFTNKQLIEGLYAQRGLLNILDDLDDIVKTTDGYTDRDTVLNQFIRDAEQFIYIRLSTFFEATAMVGNPWVTSRATWIAAYFISKRRGNEHYWEDLFVEARTELDAIATGELPPPIDIPLRDDSYPSMSNLIVDEMFSIAKLRVRPEISVGGTYPDQHVAYGGWWWGWR